MSGQYRRQNPGHKDPPKPAQTSKGMTGGKKQSKTWENEHKDQE